VLVGLVFAAALACPASVAAAAAIDPGADYVRAELVAEQDGVVPGQAAALGLRLRHAPHWHTYWVMPGDAGLPTQLKWKLEPGYVAGPVQWPVPELLRVGELANYGYEGTVLLPVSVQVPASAPTGGTATFALHADWLVCNDLCIPGGADLSIGLPIRAAADTHLAPEAAAIAAARRLVPGPIALGAGKASLNGQRLALEFAGPRAPPRTLEFFPYEAGRIEAAAKQRLTVRGQQVRLELQAATPVGADFRALRGVLVADGGPGAGANGWAGTIDLPLKVSAASLPAVVAGATPGSPGPAQGAPPAGGFDGSAAPVVGAAPARAVALASSAPAPGGEARPSSAVVSLALALAGAFLGGLILNLMPCVFPVLSLKLIALVQHRGVAPARLRLHGAAFALGVVLSFLGLAGLLLAFRAAGSQIGWGFQLQSPLVIAGLIGLFFVIGLNLLGAFEFTLGSAAIDRVANSVSGMGAESLDDLAEPEGLGGSFATGVLAALVASPCTAPFMGAALGFAVTQSAPLALLVFAALGAGMATPYLVLTLVPSWLERLPRPGAWMERLKQIMAFPMFLTCVWLFWVLGQQIDMDAVAGMLAALVGVGLWAWATGLVQRGAPRYRWLAGVAVLATLATLAPLLRSALRPEAATGLAALTPRLSSLAPGLLAETGPVPVAAWSHWTQNVQVQALAQGNPVFVDFTAAWCITCQANKRLVLHDERVEAAFRAHGVVRLQADWTRRDEAISRELARLQRSGVPVYVLYDRRGVQHVLPEILSTQAVLDALAAV
jgi:thiol:disulfide interchange protein DsbD